MNVGFGQLFIILMVILILFGAGRLPQVMGELGKGLRTFRDELNKKGNKNQNEE